MTWWELVKFLVLGRIRGFDAGNENRCHHYAGHERFDTPHEDYTGLRWNS